MSDEKEESVVMTRKALVGTGVNNTLEIIVEIKDRVPMRGSRREPSIVLFFAPEDANLGLVSKPFNKFEKYVVASLMDQSSRNSNSTSRFLSQTIEGEKEIQLVEEEFSFLDSGFLKLTREGGYVTAYTSVNQTTWNQVGDSQLLPVELQDANLKAGLRVKRNSRDYYALSVDGQFSFSKYADPIEDPIDEDPGHKIYDISIDVNKLCSDSIEGGLSTTLINDLEYAILDYFNETYASNPNVTFESVMIVGDRFEEGLACPTIQEEVADSRGKKNGRQLTRRLLYSTLYFILNGYCYGACPSNPSSHIDTVNRRNLKSSNQVLLSKIQSVTPQADEVVGVDSSAVDCTRNNQCKHIDGRCCGYEDCFCPYNVIEICDDSRTCRRGNCCRPAYIPKCEFSMTCDRTIDITEDKSTIVFGQSHEPHEFPKFRVYSHDPDEDKWYQRGLLERPPTSRVLQDDDTSSRRVISSSVSISNDGERVALGSNLGKKVKIFHLESDNLEDKWTVIKSFTSNQNLFGQSVSLNPVDGTMIAIGSPINYYSETGHTGEVHVYQEINNRWKELSPTIGKDLNEETLGWRVDIDKNNIVHVGYKNKPTVLSYQRINKKWELLPDNDGLADSDLKNCFMQTSDNCQTTFSDTQ